MFIVAFPCMFFPCIMCFDLILHSGNWFCALFSSSLVSVRVDISEMAPAKPKRKSTTEGGGGKAKQIKGSDDLQVPVDALLKDHVRIFDQWL